MAAVPLLMVKVKHHPYDFEPARLVEEDTQGRPFRVCAANGSFVTRPEFHVLEERNCPVCISFASNFGGCSPEEASGDCYIHGNMKPGFYSSPLDKDPTL